LSAGPVRATARTGQLNKENIMKNEQLPAIEIKIKQPPVLFTKTQALIAQLAQRLGGPLVAY
jgi:hypothetical protein